MIKSFALGAAAAATLTLFAGIAPASADPSIGSSGRRHQPPAMRDYTPPPARTNPNAPTKVVLYKKIELGYVAKPRN
jgi:hypothetical protein